MVSPEFVLEWSCAIFILLCVILLGSIMLYLASDIIRSAFKRINAK